MAGYGTSSRSAAPSAPPQEAALTMRESGSQPPGYEAVLANDSLARQNATKVRNRSLMGSVAYAGG